MDAIHELYHALTTSDYVLVGAGAGLSAAAGISYDELCETIVNVSLKLRGKQ